MSSLISELEQVTEGALANGVGFGLALTAAPALTPLATALRQTAWETDPNLAPDVYQLAAGVAQGQVDPGEAQAWARKQGISDTAFAALVSIANVGPGSGYAFELWRRNIIGEQGFRRAVKRLGWEQEWIDDAVQIKDVLLSPEALAVMIQRSVVPNPGILPNQPPTDNSDVPPMPVVDLDPVTEAAGSGTTLARLEAMARIIGLPASPDLAARMHFRKIINEHAFNQAIKEGNTRGEWAPFLLEGFREIPTAEQYVEAHLRGWITKPEMYAGTALHGMSQPDTDLEFQIHRRPLTPHQIKQALARGASFNPEAGEITNPYSASVHQNNLGPEWYELATSLAGSYPSVFVTNRLVDDQTITPEIGKTWREKAGDADEVVAALFKSWKAKAGGGAAADPHVTKAENQLWTAQHSSYVKDRSDDAFATATLTELGVASGAIPTVLRLWQRERAIVKAGLSPAQIKKAYSEGTFTQPEAVARLVELQWSAADAGVYLGE